LGILLWKILGVRALAYFGVSAIFHYLGPAFAVLLFARVDVLGVAWLRIASAAVVFALWRRPWRLLRRLTPQERWVLLGLGVVLAAMNATFYLALDRLPLATVGGIEFAGVIVLAAIGVRNGRNAVALVLAVAGVVALTDLQLAGAPLGFALAFVNCALFMLYVILGHRIANAGDGIDQLGAAMLVAAVVATPFCLGAAVPAFTSPDALLAGIGVGICSSVIPYVTDQLAMARLRRETFALMLSILPAVATVIGIVVLAQVPTVQELAGITLIALGVAVHQERASAGQAQGDFARAAVAGVDHDPVDAVRGQPHLLDGAGPAGHATRTHPPVAGADDGDDTALVGQGSFVGVEPEPLPGTAAELEGADGTGLPHGGADR
jgi:inner membrane transporter RhtA